jgi:hypothetical protein
LIDFSVFERATQKTPIEAHFMITHMQIVLGVFLLLLLIAFFFQVRSLNHDRCGSTTFI